MRARYVCNQERDAALASPRPIVGKARRKRKVMVPLTCLFCADDFYDAEETRKVAFDLLGVDFTVASITATGVRSTESSDGQG